MTNNTMNTATANNTDIMEMVKNALNNYIKDRAGELLSEYDYPWSDYGMNQILTTFLRNKETLIRIFANHPNWDVEHLYIHFSADLHRYCDPKAVETFNRWVTKKYKELIKENEFIYEGKTVDEWYLKYCDASYNECQIYYTKWKEAHKLARKTSYYSAYYDTYYTNPTIIANEIPSLAKFLDYFKRNICSSPILVADDSEERDDAKYVNDLFAWMKKPNGNPMLRVQNGQKWSRVINKVVGELYGLNKVVENVTETWTTINDNTGEVVEHSRTKNIGYNGQFSALADGINPLTITRHTVLSLNPIDYWTMSFGKGWASCHTIDKENRRQTSHNYEGCYSSGTESYMLDKVSFIMYTVTPDYNESDGLEFADKERRCVFMFGEDKLIQSRVYPDGRDGGDASIAGDFRRIAQKVIADCLGVPNLWKLERKNADRYINTVSGSTHYPDYAHYSDNTVSFLKKENEEKNVKMIPVGHKPICPDCGIEHTQSENILCPDCSNDADATCERCGCAIIFDRDDYIYDSDREVYYCDSECAANDGCYWCENDGEYHSDNVYWDDYAEEWFYSRWNDHVETEDGHVYMDAENAERAGYREIASTGEWYHEDEVMYCHVCDEYVLTENYDEEMDMCCSCASYHNEE